MKKLLLGFLFLGWGWSGIAFAQEPRDVVGEWEGYITQEPAGLADRYYFALSLEMDGSQLRGEARIEMEDSSHIYGVMVVSGAFEFGRIQVSEEYIKQQNLWIYAYWCIKQYELSMKWVRGILILEGNWNSDACGYSEGAIHLERRLS